MNVFVKSVHAFVACLFVSTETWMAGLAEREMFTSGCKQLDEAFTMASISLRCPGAHTGRQPPASGAQNSHCEHFPIHETAQTGVTHDTLRVPSLPDALAALEL